MILPEQTEPKQHPAFVQLKVAQGQSCPDVMNAIFKDQSDPVKQFTNWMEFCKNLDLKVPSKSYPKLQPFAL
jgi:hypothetical protein